MKHILLVLNVLLLLRNPVMAQPANTNIEYFDTENFGIKEGLSQGLVNCITQDDFGFMWFGTMDGLNRYDGYNVSVFTHDPDDSNSVSDNYISTIFKDSKNRLWVGTNTGGLNLFDYKTEQFIHFKHQTNDNKSISDNHIISILEDHNGAIWVATNFGLNKIIIPDNRHTGTIKNKDLGPIIFDSPSVTFKHIWFGTPGIEYFFSHEPTKTSGYFHPNVFIDLKGQLFVRTETINFCIDPSTNYDDRITVIPAFMPDPKYKEIIKSIISAIGSGYEMQELLYVLAMKYIAEIDKNTGLVAPTNNFVTDGITLRNSNPFANNILWLVCNFRLYQYNIINQQITEIQSHESRDKIGIEHSTSLYKDRNGKIWAGTSGYGVLKFNATNEKFHRVQGPSVHWLYSNTHNKVIIKEGDSTFLLEQNSRPNNLPGWQKSNSFSRSVFSQLHGAAPKATIQEKGGTVWVQSDGIKRYDPQKQQLDALVQNPIRWSALYLDDENNCWYAEDTILCKINNRSFEVAKFPIPREKSFVDFYISTIFRDALHVLWVGTTAGLFRFDEATQNWNQYSFRANDLESLSSNHVLSICPDANCNYLWLGTNSGGFNRFNKETGVFERYTVRDGLPNNVVYGILSDKSNNLWMSTNNGISCFDPITKKFENYTTDDGLQGNEFNTYAYCKTTDGTMFFGGVAGYNYFNPEDVKSSQPVPGVVITDIKKNGRSLGFHETGSPLSVPLYLAKKIVLDFLNNTMSFDFSSMDFRSPGNDKYQYMLEGVDKDWILSTTNHSAVYSNLQPGTYTFKVTTGGSRNEFSSLDITILTPWYLTWWFITTIVIIVLALVYLFYRYNLNYEINLFKDHQRIASDLHDEIGSTLSSIHIYSEVALSKIVSKPLETETYLKQISNNVENTIGSLDDIVWALNAKNDRFEDVGNRMRAAAVSICEASGYTLHLHFDEELNELKFGKETRKNLFLIYKEALNNVVKYAKGKNLYINLSSANNVIILSIMDDGKGFEDNNTNEGNGLNNMRRRASDLKGDLEIISSPDKGTKVILKFYRNSKR